MMPRAIRRVVVCSLVFHAVLLGTCATMHNWWGVAVNFPFLVLRMWELDGAA